ncbi:MAG: hypothetical protein KIT14_17055 [bacterium]|nr:hypothetical protein [bacterium]
MLAGCGGGGSSIPDATSPGAQVLLTRCGQCHGIHSPGSMTIGMWDYQLERMRGIFAQRGMPWLSAEDEQALRAYLTAHAGTR